MNDAASVRAMPSPYPTAGRAIRVAALALLVAALAVLGGPGLALGDQTPVRTAHAEPSPGGVTQSDLVAYTMVDQWPEREEATSGLFQDPIDLDMAADGRVFIADVGINGIHTLLPTGAFTVPFGVTGGFPQQLGRVGRIAVGPDPQASDGELAERVYALDMATHRVVVFGLDGQYIDAWEDINAESIAASSDGRVYVLDRDTTQVRALDAASGAELFAFGDRGTGEGQFSNFTDVAVSPDGRVLAVGDLRAKRVQLFDMATDEQLAAEGAPAPATFRREYDFNSSRFNKGDYTCRAGQLSALGEDKVFAGEAATACLIDGTDVEFAIASSANNSTICRETVITPRLRADTQQYFALATYDPNAGKCGQKRTELPTSRVVVRYSDESLRSVRALWHAESNEEVREPVLFAPRRLTMPSPDTIFVEDSSTKLRFYGTDGTLKSTVARDSSVTDAGTDTMFFRLMNSDGTEKLGEVYAAYVRVQRSADRVQAEMGIGRYRNEERQGPSGPVDVVEAVWTHPIAQMTGGPGQRPGGGRRGKRLEIPQLAYNSTSGELLLLLSEVVEQQRSVDMKIMRFLPDGEQITELWDVPDDGQVNPYADMSVGPDGRIYLLDDLTDVVRIYTSDGQPAGEVPVAPDARSPSPRSRPPYPSLRRVSGIRTDHRATVRRWRWRCSPGSRSC